MLIALLFSYLISVLVGGESAPFLLVEDNKLVKECILDDDRRDAVLEILQNAKEEHKTIKQEIKPVSKALDKIAKDRGAKDQEFKDVAQLSYDFRVRMQRVNLEAVMASRDQIEEAEWELMAVEFRKANKKKAKKIKKRVKQVDKGFNKIEKKFRRVIEEEEKADVAVASLRNFEDKVFFAVDRYLEYMLQEDAIIYNYDFSEEEAMKLQGMHIKNLGATFDALREMHFVVVENTSEREWRKLDNKLVLPF